MTDTIVTAQISIQTVEIDSDQIVVVQEKNIQVVTAGTQGPQGIQGVKGDQGLPGSPAGLTGSYNISISGGYGGVFNITLVNGLVRAIGIYGM